MRSLPSLLCCALTGCQVSVTIPDGPLDEIARGICKVGHPTATFERGRVVGFETGWFSDERSVDVAIDYRGVLAATTKTLTVRLHVDSVDPCEVRTEVLGDTGANPPVLLDNWVASPIVGGHVCAAFE